MAAPAFQGLREWVGRERSVDDDLPPFPANALAAALDRAPIRAGDPLPHAWHWLYFLEAPPASATGADGHPRMGDFLPPVPLPRRMWAAGALRFERPLRLGCPATRRSRIESIEAKTGKSGTMLFVTLEHQVLQDGLRCVREEQTLVYREMPAAPAPLPPGEPAPTMAQWSRTMRPDPVLLFRYSALTFNGHRIHYDRDYAVSREFYPALVVHGPLLATLLLNLAHDNVRDVPIAAFRYRAVRPTFDHAPFTLAGARDGRGLRLWSSDGDGFTGMSATAVLA